MRPNYIQILILGLSLLILVNQLSYQATAQTADIQIIDIKHQLINTTQIGTRTAHYYTFFITFSNRGDQKTANTTAYLEDPELNARLEITSFVLQPNQNKTVIYENWPTTLQGETTINITYQPTSTGTPQTKYNTGKQAYTFIIGTAQNTNETPGFQVILSIIAIFLVNAILIKKKAEN